MKSVIKKWEDLTGFVMDYDDNKAFHQLDVNNYIMVRESGKIKTKGRFVVPKLGGVDLRHTPNYQICARAVIDYIDKGTPLEKTIVECEDLQEFLLTQQVRGDWEVSWMGEKMGKMLRFYKSTGMVAGPIIRRPLGPTGNTGTVTESDDCIPVADLPKQFPDDIDYDWYLAKTLGWLTKLLTPKNPFMNDVAMMLINQGLTPCIVKTTAKRLSRAKPKIGSIDFCSIAPGESIGVATGKPYHVIAKRIASGEVTNLIKVQRHYPSKTRPKIIKDYGFELIYGGSVPIRPWAVRLQPVSEPLEQYYTETELRKSE